MFYQNMDHITWPIVYRLKTIAYFCPQRCLDDEPVPDRYGKPFHKLPSKVMLTSLLFSFDDFNTPTTAAAASLAARWTRAFIGFY